MSLVKIAARGDYYSKFLKKNLEGDGSLAKKYLKQFGTTKLLNADGQHMRVMHKQFMDKLNKIK